jgi:hypothetical protein
LQFLPDEADSNKGIPAMDDYSFQNVSWQPAKVGDKLTTHEFGTGVLAYDDASGFPEARIVVLPRDEDKDPQPMTEDFQKHIACVD